MSHLGVSPMHFNQVFDDKYLAAEVELLEYSHGESSN
jgi:hypothetical protein